MKETFSSQSFWNVTDVNQLNQDARLNATITELILLIQAFKMVRIY
jgi:hypothetical protein